MLALEKVGVRPVGVILNMLTRSRGNYDDNYGYYYTYRPDRSRGKRSDDERSAAADDLLARIPTEPAVAAPVAAPVTAPAPAPTKPETATCGRTSSKAAWTNLPPSGPASAQPRAPAAAPMPMASNAPPAVQPDWEEPQAQALENGAVSDHSQYPLDADSSRSAICKTPATSTPGGTSIATWRSPLHSDIGPSREISPLTRSKTAGRSDEGRNRIRRERRPDIRATRETVTRSAESSTISSRETPYARNGMQHNENCSSVRRFSQTCSTSPSKPNGARSIRAI